MSKEQKRTGDEVKRKPRPSGRIYPASRVPLTAFYGVVLLLRRVAESRSFASAYVFPGGQLDEFHDSMKDGQEPVEDSIYRWAAVRETFEETGILLARTKSNDGPSDAPLLQLTDNVANATRKRIHNRQENFREWLASVGGVPDDAGLIPFTRWNTPLGMPKRFTTQMYLYMLPISPTNSSPTGHATTHNEVFVPKATHDGGIEHNIAEFDDVSTWLAKARAGEIILFPPQAYLLHLMSEFLTGRPPQGSDEQHASSEAEATYYQAQREALIIFLNKKPTARPADAPYPPHPTAQIAWAEKVMSPKILGKLDSGKRAVLEVSSPGPELMKSGSKAGGDYDRVILVEYGADRKLSKVDVKWRQDVMGELEREKLAVRGETAKL
ncbi:NUDIX domain-containing protein [Podospora didyma]|uniref:NUDIX domain-containing protein n=1 Tax=Podospora didyma TaxID=330526 RepID=A0AAE0P3N9_9PEZI|nr:NUDIX domain-containing protein [Podospora didyma]